MTQIEVSCPSCGKTEIVEMEAQRENPFVEMFSERAGVKNYSFMGNKICQCRRIICVTVNVVSK